MTLTDALELDVDAAALAAGIHAGADAPLTVDERIRVEAMLAIEEHVRLLDEARMNVARSALRPDAHSAALADWIVGLVADARRSAVLEAVGDVDALETSQAAIVELAAAHATFVEVAGQATRIEQVRAIVRRGLTLSQSYDLANTLEAERDALRGRLQGILAKYPELQQLMSDDVVARSAELQRPDGSPIV